jgi:predicted N-acetyltransferase YhbS
LVELLPLMKLDTQSVEDLLDAAFGPDRFGRTAYRIRQGLQPVDALSFALQGDDGLIGVIQCWPVAHHGADGRITNLVMVGPVAVRPDIQGGGHGRALMDKMVESAQAQADGALMMIGDPEYYGRFWGFNADATGAWDLPGPFEQRRLLGLEVNGHRLPAGAGMIAQR